MDIKYLFMTAEEQNCYDFLVVHNIMKLKKTLEKEFGKLVIIKFEKNYSTNHLFVFNHSNEIIISIMNGYGSMSNENTFETLEWNKITPKSSRTSTYIKNVLKDYLNTKYDLNFEFERKGKNI